MSKPSMIDLPEPRPLASAARRAAHPTALRVAAMALASALLALPLAAEPGDLDPTYGGGDGYEIFDLGGDFAICAVDVTADGTIVIAANTAGGSEIWRVDADGTNVALVRSYSFAGAPDCDQGLRALTCPDDGTSCYGAGARSAGGDDDTWVVAFDWRTGLADPGVLSQGEVIADFAPGGSDGAYAVNVFPPQGEPEEILTAGTAGDFGLTARFKRGEPVTGNTVMISGQTTVIRWQEVAAGVAESLEVGHRNGAASRAGEVEGLRWKAGETIFAGDRYVWVCREKLVGGEWVNDKSFGDGGCWKEESTAEIKGFKVVEGQALLLLKDGDDVSLEILLEDGSGLAQEPIPITNILVFTDQEEAPFDPDSVELLCRDPEINGIIVAFNGDQADGKEGRVADFFGLENGTLKRRGGWVRSSRFVDQPSLSFFAEYLTGTQLARSSSSPGTSGSRIEVQQKAALPPYDTIVFVERDGPGIGANLLVSRVEAPASGCDRDTVLCLGGDRFEVEMDWASPAGSGRGTAVSLTDDTGYFWFFDAANVEAVIKVLDACPLNNRFWVFAGGLTDVEVEMRVTDTATGEVVTYMNPQGTAFQPIQDTGAFDSCDALATASGAERTRALIAPPSWSSAEVSGGGAPGGSPSLGVLERSSPSTGTGTVLTLGGGRFEVRLDWRTGTASGQGAAEQLTSDTGYFWFFDADNVELVIKVLDACAINGRFWVFAGGLTDVEATLTVTDTQGGQSTTYENPGGTPFQPIQDTDAFATCP